MSLVVIILAFFRHKQNTVILIKWSDLLHVIQSALSRFKAPPFFNPKALLRILLFFIILLFFCGSIPTVRDYLRTQTSVWECLGLGFNSRSSFHGDTDIHADRYDYTPQLLIGLHEIWYACIKLGSWHAEAVKFQSD